MLNMKRYTAYVNGNIYPDLRNPVKVECLVTDSKRVVFCGSLETARREYSPQEIDLQGFALFPAFQDAHGHLTDLGRSLTYPDLNLCNSEEEMLQMMKKSASQFDEKQWIIGRGWDQNKWEKKEFPNNERLNEWFPDRPVLLVRTDSHAALLNQTALALSETEWKNYFNSENVVKREGKPTGILMDEAYYSILSVAAEPESAKRKLIQNAVKHLISKGIVSIGDAWWTADDRALFMKMNEMNELDIRVYGMMLPEPENKSFFESNGIYRSGMLHVRAFKYFADGALGSRGAALLDEYSDKPGHKGTLLNDPAYWSEQAIWCSHYGAQMVTHAIGDSANRMILNLYTKHLKAYNYKRWRIEHAQMVHKEDIEIFKPYGIIPVVQACHAVSDFPWVESRVGAQRMESLYRYNDFLSVSEAVPNTTDFPIESPDVIKNLYAAIFRQNHQNEPLNGFRIDQAIHPAIAIKSVTFDAAFAQFEESEYGNLLPGSQAEIVIVDNNLINSTKEEFLKTKVVYVRRGESVLLD